MGKSVATMDDQSLIEMAIDSRGFMFVRLGTIAVHIVIDRSSANTA